MTKSFFHPIAVVGLSGVFPMASGTDAFWHNITHKVNTVIEVPVERWIGPREWVFSQSQHKEGMAYSRHACLVEGFDHNIHGLMLPESLIHKMDPLHQWVLYAAHEALQNTQIKDLDRNRMGIILAAIALPTDLSSKISRQFLSLELFKNEPFNMASKPLSFSDALCGRVVGFPSAIVSKALGLGGVSYTLDAACASSLYALKLACDELQHGRADVMLAGGVSRPDNLYTQVGFSQLHALSVSGRCAPFDASADGLVVGEGAGVIVLKRLEDAIGHGDTIYGVIHGIGLSNDMRGNLLAPESAGQLRAMQAAYTNARWHPHDVDFIECHGAGTPVGDVTELTSLRSLWGNDGWQKGQCALGAIKSMIGHLLTAAGAAGLIKTLLALHHKTLPPSINFERPGLASPLIDSPFRVQMEVAPWPQRNKTTPRRAAVSAFGFGGINAHILLEDWPATIQDSRTESLKISSNTPKNSIPDIPIAIVGMDVTLGGISSIQAFQEAIFNGRPILTDPPPNRWKAPEAVSDRSIRGGYIEKIAIEIGEFQIPPSEIPDILPQQLLMLKKAAGALRDAGLALREMRERMGAIIGIGFDYEATNFHLRWALPFLAENLKRTNGIEIEESDLSRWLKNCKDDCGAPLTASRTLGALGGIVASRIAREFRLGGPSFVVSNEEISGLHAVKIAMDLLQSGDVDTMLVGAVDLNCDERNMATLYSRLSLSPTGTIRPFDTEADGTLPGEGAVALVLKRLEDAIQDKDRIYAVVEGIGHSSQSITDAFFPGIQAYTASLEQAFKNSGIRPDHISLMETQGCGIPVIDHTETQALHTFFQQIRNNGSCDPIAIGATVPLVGHCGIATGLASLVKAALSLYHRIIPALPNYKTPALDLWHQHFFHLPIQSRFWAHNKNGGPRKACIAAMSSTGNCSHVILSETDRRKNVRQSRNIIQETRPTGPLPYALFLIQGANANELKANIQELKTYAAKMKDTGHFDLQTLAHYWYMQQGNPQDCDCKMAIVTESFEHLNKLFRDAQQAAESDTIHYFNGRNSICYLSNAHQTLRGRVAFVYPGSGNHYIGMGRSLGVHFPEVLQEMNEAADHFKTQMLPQWYDPWRVDWSEGWERDAYQNLLQKPLYTIFGQVLFGCHMTHLLKKFHLNSNGMIGYSLGESAGLFAIGAWPNRGEMFDRLMSTDLFRTQLFGPCESARKAWKIPENQPFLWQVAVVNRAKSVVDEAIADFPYVRRLIINTPDQTVIGGDKKLLKTVIEKMGCDAVYLDGVVTVHCDAVQPAAAAYKELHRFPTYPVKNMRVYSCAFEGSYDINSEATAESITRQALYGFDFTRTIERAYEEGFQIFVELGPNSSCSAMIDKILGKRPHLAVSANRRGEDEPLTLLKCLGTLFSAGLEINLDFLYKRTSGLFSNDRFEIDQQIPPKRTIEIPVGGQCLSLTHAFPMQTVLMASTDNETAPSKPSQAEKAMVITGHLKKRILVQDQGGAGFQTGGIHAYVEDLKPGSNKDIGPKDFFEMACNFSPSSVQSELRLDQGLDFNTIIQQLNSNVAATSKAHESYLALSQKLTAQFGEVFSLQNQLAENIDPEDSSSFSLGNHRTAAQKNRTTAEGAGVFFTREQCMQFATGSVGQILGPDFAVVDSFKARVRLPDEPLMLVDRILSVEGQKLSLGAGQVITEHDVLPDAWYLDGNRAPVCISVEAGQADLFLCAYLGIDHKVQGQRTYRLLDAEIRFHRGLPKPGDTIRYDIHIDKFMRQEDTYLFFFRFEGFIGQDHLITMTNGCAGFFTDEEVRNSGGILLTKEDRETKTTVNGVAYEPLLPFTQEQYDDHQIEALRQGDASRCFGGDFSGIKLPPALCLPSGRMRLIHRVLDMQPQGGRFSKGFIKAEADIHPEDWFLKCHFMDDMVMPGTLMYECCAHTLRVLMMRLGWVTTKTDVAYEPVEGVPCRLKCRGPVTPHTHHVHYIVEIKEMGYHPEPYVIADAHMYADNHYVVFFKDMSMQMTGITLADILDVWHQEIDEISGANKRSSLPGSTAIFSQEHILAFAIGKPSEAYGAPYSVFDEKRKIARLPGPPYCFMNRITAIDHEPWILKPDGWVTAEYDVPADAWYFTADQSGIMPFCVLLEVALQPCGWLAAYAGSALHSENDLKFRNLGGKAIIYDNLVPKDQSLIMRTRMTKVSEAADMIIEHFDFEVLHHEQMIYSGNTYFGFFTEKALLQQVGLRERVYLPSEEELKNSTLEILVDTPPLTPDKVFSGTFFSYQGLKMPAKALRMIDGIEIFSPDGGPHGLGFIRGFKIVNPQEWFFKAHFYQDPVCPGSLGVESFLQLLKFAALKRWPHLIETHRFVMAPQNDHQWSYRGQVIPTNQRVTVDGVITQIENGEHPVITADGWLHVDGITIYKMENFSIKLIPIDQ